MSTTIQHPLHLGYEGQKVKNLQEVLLSFIQDGTLTLTDGTDLNGFRTEMKDSFFGSHTADVVRDFRTLKSIETPETTLVDEDTANEINTTYQTNLDAVERFISGRLINSNQKPLAGLSITIFDVDLRSRQTLGTTTSDANGNFQLNYDKPDYDSIEKGTADIQLDVALGSGAVVTSQTYYNATGQFIEYVIEDEETTAYTSEYQELATKITALLDTGITLDDLILDDVDHLVSELNENENLIKNFVYAHMHKVTTSVQADVFYGLFRQLLPTELEALLNQGGPSLKSALQISVATNIIDHYAESEIDAFVTALLNTYSALIIDTKSEEIEDSKTYRILTLSMTDDMIGDFIDHYKENINEEGFWDELQSSITGMTSAIEEKLKYSLTLALLTGNSPGMVKQLIERVTEVYDTEGMEYGLDEETGFFVRDSDDVNFTLEDDILISEDETEEMDVESVVKETVNPTIYVAKTSLEWESMVIDAKNIMFADFIFPDYVEGTTDAEKVTSYAKALQVRFDKSYPNETLQAHISKDTETPFTSYKADIGTFMSNNATFDIRTAPAVLLEKEDTEFDFTDVSKESFIGDVATLQRLGRFTTSYDIIKTLHNNGVSSARDLTHLPKGDFIESYSTIFEGESNAAMIYDNAYRVVAVAKAVAANIYSTMTGYLDSMYSTEDDEEPEPGGLGGGLPSHLPGLQELFGNLDFCSCKHCRSVYGPSAYLVDTMEMLRKVLNNNAYQQLKTKRDDLWEMELSCINTNTAMPYIDLVNEILEDVIISITASSPTGIYSITSRNTSLSEEQLRAFPEHIDISSSSPSVYTTLKDAVYPWSIPYNYYQNQNTEFLKVIDVKPYDVAQTFSSLNEINALDDIDFASTFLGLTETQRDLITQAATSSTTPALKQVWGVFPNDTIINPDPNTNTATPTPTFTISPTNLVGSPTLHFGRVDVFLQQSKLLYNDLLELLDCYWINPVVGSVRKLAVLAIVDPNISATTCKINELRIDGLDDTDLDKIHRFVRLSRTLGWSFYELDRVFTAIAQIQNPGATPPAISLDDTALKTIAQLKRLTEVLNTSIDDTLIFYDNVQTAEYRKYSGDDPEAIPTQYEKLFRNGEPSKMLASSYPFGADPFDTNYNIANPGAAFGDNDFEALAGCIGTSISDVKYLVNTFQASSNLVNVFSGSTDFNHNNVSTVVREFLLADFMGVNIKDWCIYRDWFSATLNPFSNLSTPTSANPKTTLQFIQEIKQIKASGISIQDLQYLFDDTIVADDLKDKKEEEIKTIMHGLRNILAKESEYFAENDTDGSILQKRLEYVLPVNQASKIVKILLEEPGSSGAFSFDPTWIDELDYSLDLATPPLTSDSLVLDFLISLPDATFTTSVKEKLLGDVSFNPITVGANISLQTKAERLDYFFELVAQVILRAVVREFVATTFKVNVALSGKVLENIQENAYLVYLDHDFIDAQNPGFAINLSLTSHQDAYIVTSKIHKFTTLIEHYEIDHDEVLKLYDKYAVYGMFDIMNMGVSLPGASASPTSFSDWTNFINWMSIKAVFDQTDLSLFDVLETTTKSDWMSAIQTAFGISESDLGVLVGASLPLSIDDIFSLTTGFGTTLGSQNLTADFYNQLFSCFKMQSILESDMLSCATIAQNIMDPDDQNKADTTLNLIKTRYSDQQWLNVLRPINDRLRIQRRDAMIAYILGNPPTGYRGIWESDNDLFETLLIDTKMEPCMLTTRVKQAISTIQLFVDRVTLGLERDVNSTRITIEAETTRQWNLWRKFYRVWEANRKVFLYPENWIEPELRDNKSPFFVEFEKFLKQNEVTPDNVERAYKTYLERLDEVSGMDPVGILTDPTTLITHAFARTKSNPHIYYYRSRVQNEWTAWEKMEVQIDGNHVIPVMFRGRLRLYWLVFTPDTLQNSAMTEIVGAASTRWKLELAWTELRDGQWQAKQVGKQSLYTSYITEQDHTVESFERRFVWGEQKILDLDFSFKGDLDELKEKGIIFYCKRDNEGNLQFVVGEHNRSMHGVGGLGGWLYSKGVDFNDKVDGVIDGKTYNFSQRFHIFMDEYRRTRPQKTYLWSVGVFHDKYNGIVTEQHGKWVKTLENSYYKNLRDIEYDDYNTSYIYSKDTADGYTHDPDISRAKLLGRAPNYELGKHEEDKFVVFDRQVPEFQNQTAKVFVHKFFYHDYRNSFFAEKKLNRIVVGGPFSGKGSIGIGISGGASSNNLKHLLGGPGQVSFNDPGGFVTKGGSISAEPMHRSGTGEYRFYPFYHYNVHDLSTKLSTEGLDGLFDYAFANAMFTTDEILFSTEYQPTSHVDARYPESKLDFSYDGAFSLYNWELFFHIPLLVANKLMQDQKFFEARKWYHYIFDPTTSRTGGSERYWNFIPFNLEAVQGIPSIQNIINPPTNNPTYSADLIQAIENWQRNPFNPHLVARTRLGAYMKNVVMKYIDNLIAWGDQLFRRDTMESINEATLMYILAAQILGRRPIKMPVRATTSPKTYQDFVNSGSINAFSNAIFKIETLLLPTGYDDSNIVTNLSTTRAGETYYFCIPPNAKLLAYWDIVADRLFKIRHCQSIDGVERQLALFAPPIDPALLVKAAANGVSVSDAVGDILSPLPQYKFVYMAQKATEIAQEVKSLGGALLAALEKRDAEQIALLRSSHEQTMLNAVKQLREMQVKESQIQVETLLEQKNMIEFRIEFYDKLVEDGLNVHESLQLESLQRSIPLKVTQGVLQTLGGALSTIPNFKLGSWQTIGATFGGNNLAGALSASSSAVGIAATVNDIIGSMAATKGSFKRREEEWKLQSKLAQRELKQIEKQLIASEIRQAVSETEFNNHELQMKQSFQMDEAMRNKYTNEQLYDWMVGELAMTYFQTYNLALDVAKRAERCYHYELGVESATSGFITFGYWDSLKKGLMAGENLLLDIKRMDVSFMEQHKRQHEMTKHISLANLDPEKLMELKNNKSAQIEIPEWLFDMDYPGHYFRRIKSVSVSIPCVAGPYTSVSCKLSMNGSRYRKNTLLNSAPEYVEVANADERFTYLFGGGQSIATSHAQNDSGMFEFNFRDERYLPFEGAGAISDWTIELPSKYAQFDYDTITDVIIHINYTARYDGGLFKEKAEDHLETSIVEATGDAILPRIFSLKQEFANEWNAYKNAIEAWTSGDAIPTLDLEFSHEMFPFFCADKDIEVGQGVFDLQKIENAATIDDVLLTNDLTPASSVTVDGDTHQIDASLDFVIPKTGSFTLKYKLESTSPTAMITTEELDEIRDIQFALIYKLA